MLISDGVHELDKGDPKGYFWDDYYKDWKISIRVRTFFPLFYRDPLTRSLNFVAVARQANQLWPHQVLRGFGQGGRRCSGREKEERAKGRGL